MEAMGKEPDPNKMPLPDHMFPIEVQYALVMHNFLPDSWDGASGSYMGKDWAAITELLNSFNIYESRQEVVYFTKLIDRFHIQSLNDKISEDRKKEERKSKARSGAKTPTIKR